MACEDIVLNAAGQGMLNCLVSQGFGLDWFLFSLVCLGIIAFIGFAVKLPALLSIGLGFVVVYSFSLLSGGGYYFDLMLVLLGFGIIINIVLGVLGMVDRHAG